MTKRQKIANYRGLHVKKALFEIFDRFIIRLIDFMAKILKISIKKLNFYLEMVNFDAEFANFASKFTFSQIEQ